MNGQNRKVPINQYASKGVTEQVDNLILQAILGMAEEAKLKEDEMIAFQLNKCPFCQKQNIIVKDIETDEMNAEAGICLICEKPTDNTILAYQIDIGTEIIQLISLESEAEALVDKIGEKK